MANLSDKINAARQEGYSDEEIVTHLSSTPDLQPKIDAARKEGYSDKEIADYLGGAAQEQPAGDQVSSIGDQFAAGAESNFEQTGQSLEIIGKSAGSDKLKNTGTWLRNLTNAPKNFVSATERFKHPKEGDSYVDPVFGFGWGNLPGAAAEMAGAATGDVTARVAGTGVGMGLGAAGGTLAGPGGTAAGAAAGGVAGAFAGPALFGFISSVGPLAQERAQNAGREEPNWEDWTAAAAASGAIGALDAFGVGKIGILNSALKDAAKSTTKEMVKETAKDVAKNVGRGAVSGTGQSVIQQYATTAGTPGGAKIDLKEAVGQGIAQGAGGGVLDVGLKGPRAAYRIGESARADYTRAKYGDDAQIRAEFTQDVNDIANRMKDGEQTALEVNRNLSDFRRQVSELIDGQDISPKDKQALKGGLVDANGLSTRRLEEIASRAQDPEAIKALIRKVQVVREMTVQQQSHKGVRGVGAAVARGAGAAIGGAAGAVFGGHLGAGSGALVGENVGKWLGRYLSGSQTQGHRINKLVGKWQSRQAEILLNRYGPSKATEALNSLTERAAANKMQQEEEARATQQFNDTMAAIRNWQAMRKRSMADEEKAKTSEDKKKYQKERQDLDLAYRNERLKSITMQKLLRAARTEQLVQRLEKEKSLNALSVELAQVRNDLAKATAEAKKAQMDRSAQEQVNTLRSKEANLALQIATRNEALKKSQIMTKRAQIMLEKTQGIYQPTEAAQLAKVARKKYEKMTAKDLGNPKLDQFGAGIVDEAHYGATKQQIIQLQTEGMAEAKAFPDKKIGNIFIEAIGDFMNAKGRKNQQKRMDIYLEVLRKVPQGDDDAQRFIALYIKPLATVFANETSQTDGGGREDYGSPPDALDPETEIPF